MSRNPGAGGVLEDATSLDSKPERPHPGLGNVLFDVWLVSRAVIGRIDEVIRPSGLNAEEFAVYSVLAGSNGMTPTELATWMAAPPTTVSSYVKRLESRRHVRRVPNPEDGRSHHIELTSKGRAAHRTAGELFLPLLSSINEALGAEVAETQQRLVALRRIINDLEPTTPADE